MPAFLVLAHGNVHQGFQFHAQALGIQHRAVAADDAFLLQVAQPAQAGGWRESHLLRQFLVADAAVLLQAKQDAQIGGVQGQLNNIP
ncbi:hypothetical protein D3C84_1196760 [compost metagenome]